MTARINCNDKLWRTFALAAVRERQEVILVNVDEVDDAEFCQKLARENAMIFTIDPETGYGLFTRGTQS